MSKKYVSGMTAFESMEDIDRRYLAEADAFIGLNEESIAPAKRSLRDRLSFMSTGWFAAAVSAVVALGAVVLIVRAGHNAPIVTRPNAASHAAAPTAAERTDNRTDDAALYDTSASLEADENDPAVEAETTARELAIYLRQQAREANADKIKQRNEEAAAKLEAELAKYRGDPNAPNHVCEWIGNCGECIICGRKDMINPAALPANHTATAEEAEICAAVTQYLTDLHVTFDRVEYSDLAMVIIIKEPVYMSSFFTNILPNRIYSVMGSDKLPIDCPDYYVMCEGKNEHLYCYVSNMGDPCIINGSDPLPYNPNRPAVEPALCTLTEDELLAEAVRFFDKEGITVRSAAYADAMWLDIDVVITEDTTLYSSDMLTRIRALNRALGGAFQMISVRAYLPDADRDDIGNEYVVDFVNLSTSASGSGQEQFVHDGWGS